MTDKYKIRHPFKVARQSSSKEDGRTLATFHYEDGTDVTIIADDATGEVGVACNRPIRVNEDTQEIFVLPLDTN